MFSGNSTKLSPINFEYLLEPEVVGRTVKAIKIVIVIAILLILILLIRQVITHFFSSILDKQLAATVPSSVNTGQSTNANKSKDFSPIVKLNIFGPIEEANTTKPVVEAQKPISKLPLTLVGVFITDGATPFAIIENQKKKIQDGFTVGEKVFDEAELVKILVDRVEIKRNGEVEILALEDIAASKGGGVTDDGEDEYVIEEAELDKALENLPLLLQQARAVPYFKNGKSVGLRLFAIKAGSLYTKIGLKNGDILKNINGKDLGDLSEAMKLFQELKEEREFKVVLERNREQKEFSYRVR